MTTLVDFKPTPTAPFQFQAVLDGSNYACVVTWNVFGQRWYISIYAQDGTRVLTLPLVGSPPRQAIEIAGLAQTVSSMTWTTVNGGQVFVVMEAPSNFQVNDEIVISGATNSGTGGDSIVNGSFIINTWSGPKNFTFLLPVVQGAVGVIGGSILASPTTAALSWFQGVVTVFSGVVLPFPVGTVVDLTITDCVPDAYNGRFACTVETPTSFTYALTDDPGMATSVGTYCPDLNLLAGYFNTSSLVWRDEDQRFEIRP